MKQSEKKQIIEDLELSISTGREVIKVCTADRITPLNNDIVIMRALLLILKDK